MPSLPKARRGGRLSLYEAPDQSVHLGGFFHVRQVSGTVEDMHRHLVAERLGMSDRNDAILASPDDLDRYCESGHWRSEAFALPAAGEPLGGDRRQRRKYPVEPFVAQHVLDHRTADKIGIVDQLAQHVLRLAPTFHFDKAVNKGGVDLLAEAGRRYQGKARDPLGLPHRELENDGAAHRMSDEVNPVDAERGKGALDISREAGAVDRAGQRLGRAAMAGQVKRDRAVAFG